MFKRFYFHSSLYKKLLFSLILMVILPTFIFVSFYTGKINKVLKGQVTKNNSNIMAIEQKKLDQVLDSIIARRFNISLYEPVQILFKKQEAGDTGSYSYVEIIESIKEYVSDLFITEEDVHSIYIYNTRTRHLVVPFRERITSCPIEEFYDTSWLEAASDINHLKILPVRKPLDESYDEYILDAMVNTGSNVITFLYPLTWIDDDLEGVFVMNLYEKVIPASILSNEALLLDENFQVVYPMDLDEKYSSIITNIFKENKLQAYKSKEQKAIEYQGDRQYMINYAPIAGGKLYVMKINTFEEIYHSIKYYQVIVFILALATIIVGLIYSFNTVHKIYNPVERTLSMLNINTRDSAEKNELKMILNEVDATMKQNKTIHNMLKNQEQNIRQALIQKLLRGDTDINHHLLGLRDFHSCLLLSIDKYRDLVNKHSLKDQYSYKTLVLQIAQNNIRKYCDCIGMQMHEDKVLFLLTYTAEELDNIRMTKICGSIQDMIGDATDVTLTCCVGNHYGNIEQIRTSYIESLVALKHRMTYGHNSVIFYDELQQGAAEQIQDVKSLANRIINYMKVKDKSRIEESIYNYIASLRAAAIVSSDNIMEYLYPLINQINNYLSSQQDALREELGFSESLYAMVSHQETLDDVEQILLFIICKIMDHQSCDKHDNIINVIDYINNNYTDSNLDITKLSEMFDISYSHLRKRIKEYTGSTFICYINGLRVKHAKELLITSMLSVKEIAGQSGYNSEQSFLRNFKKYEGITPTAFRQFSSDREVM